MAIRELAMSGVVALVMAATGAARAEWAEVTGQTPATAAKGICLDVLPTVTFAALAGLGPKGTIKIFDEEGEKLVDTLDVGVPVNGQTYTLEGVAFHGYPVTISGNTATIHPHPGVLQYGKTYYIQIDPETFLCRGGEYFGVRGKSWTFSTKAAGPAAGAERVTVAADGTGDFCTLQGALDFVPAKNVKPVTVFMKKGTYWEIVSVVDKANVVILGEDREGTVLTYANNERLQLGNGSSNRRGVVNGLRSTGITLANMTIRNATPKGSGGWQAETVIFKSNSQALLTHVSLYSFQDTLQMSSPGYVADSYIEGDVDFMWGTGPCFFQDCVLRSVTNNDAFVVSRNTATNHGFVYSRCRFEVKAGVTGSFLANNQGYANSEVVLLNCGLAPEMDATAWRGSGAAVHYWEFNSTNLTTGGPADVSRRAAGSKRLTAEADGDVIKQYSDPAFVLGGWKPALAPIIVKQPTWPVGAGGLPGEMAVEAVAVPAATYQWLKDGKAIDGATGATLKLEKGTPGVYTVEVTNASGKVTSNPANVSTW